MAKLHKIEMYILDIDEHYGSLNETIEHINDRLELTSLHPFNVQTVYIDWHDGHKLNFSDAGYEDYSGMFPLNEAESLNGLELAKVAMLLNGLKQENAELRQQLEASQKLSEERRVALDRCSPFNAGYCKFCRIDSLTEQHKPNCDYCQLVKEGE